VTVAAPDPLAVARSALAASSTADDPEVAAFYCALARNALEEAKSKVASLEPVLLARERELIARPTSQQDLSLAGDAE
jgi:hypothetical protein